MHCDRRHEEKGVVEGGSHITHVIMRGTRKKKTKKWITGRDQKKEKRIIKNPE
jgi:hypothetical protein